MGRDKSADACWVGFDLGGTKMMAVVFDASFKPLGRARKRTHSKDGKEPAVDRMTRTIREALAEARRGDEDLAGVGIGFPGPLDLVKGVVLQAPNLGWKNFPLRDELEDRFSCPVVVGNDVDVGTYGEYRFGAAAGARCVLGVFPGTGIGGACIYEGAILHGARASCMEIGHMKVVPRGPLCGCGGRGCLESVSSRLAIAAAAAAAIYRGEAPHLAKLAGTDVSEIRSAALAESIAAGDRAIEMIVRQAARHIGTAVANAVNLLAPDLVVLGGGLIEALPKIMVEECAARAEEDVMPSFRGTFRVVPAKLGDDAGVFGAAALAANPEIWS